MLGIPGSIHGQPGVWKKVGELLWTNESAAKHFDNLNPERVYQLVWRGYRAAGGFQSYAFINNDLGANYTEELHQAGYSSATNRHTQLHNQAISQIDLGGTTYLSGTMQFYIAHFACNPSDYQKVLVTVSGIKAVDAANVIGEQRVVWYSGASNFNSIYVQPSTTIDKGIATLFEARP